MNANVETAVEKLLSGAVATTGAEHQLLMRAPLRAMDGAKDGEEDKTRPRRMSASNNAPTAEEIAKGLSRKIQCVLPCEEEKNRPRRMSASHNAPTAEEIAKGLSR